MARDKAAHWADVDHEADLVHLGDDAVDHFAFEGAEDNGLFKT